MPFRPQSRPQRQRFFGGFAHRAWIHAALRRVSAGRTTLMIAHRLSTVVHADQILVLEQGRVIEQGRHHELLARRSAYAQMWARQQAAPAA